MFAMQKFWAVYLYEGYVDICWSSRVRILKFVKNWNKF